MAGPNPQTSSAVPQFEPVDEAYQRDQPTSTKVKRIP